MQALRTRWHDIPLARPNEAEHSRHAQRQDEIEEEQLLRIMCVFVPMEF